MKKHAQKRSKNPTHRLPGRSGKIKGKIRKKILCFVQKANTRNDTLCPDKTTSKSGTG